jgi:hypothetical protein
MRHISAETSWNISYFHCCWFAGLNLLVMSCLVDQEFALDLKGSLVICGFKISFLKFKTHTPIGKAW